METMQFETRRSERGFTLVELAIVMIIIGLLIGGILKGQELIANSRVTATVAQIKGIDAATTTFQDKYDGMPGDLTAAAARLPAACGNNVACANGDGDGHLESAPGVTPVAENQQFFQQLSAADLLSDIKTSLGNVNSGFYPTAKIGGAFSPGWTAGAVLAGQIAGGPNARGGHYLTLTSDASAAVNATAISPTQAFRIDNKLDDSSPSTGSVLGSGATGGTNCALNATNYNEALDQQVCALHIRFHQ